MEQHHFKELCLTLLSFYFDEFNWNIEYNLNSNLNDFHMYASRIETEKFEKSIELSSTFYKKDDDNIDFLREKLGFNKSLEKLGVLEKIKKVYFVVCHNSKEDEFNSIVNSVIRSTIRHFYSSKLEEVEERLKKEEIEEKKLKEERFPREKSREDERRISRDRKKS